MSVQYLDRHDSRDPASDIRWTGCGDNEHHPGRVLEKPFPRLAASGHSNNGMLLGADAQEDVLMRTVAAAAGPAS